MSLKACAQPPERAIKGLDLFHAMPAADGEMQQVARPQLRVAVGHRLAVLWPDLDEAFVASLCTVEAQGDALSDKRGVDLEGDALQLLRSGLLGCLTPAAQQRGEAPGACAALDLVVDCLLTATMQERTPWEQGGYLDQQEWARRALSLLVRGRSTAAAPVTIGTRDRSSHRSRTPIVATSRSRSGLAPRNARLWSVAWGARVAAALILVAALAHCTCAPTESERMQRIQTEADLPLPAGSRLLLFAELDTVVDPAWAAKIALPAGAAAPFRQRVSSKPEEPTQVENAYRKSLSWWQARPGSLTKQYAPRPQTLVNVAVASEGTAEVVYVECMVY